MGVTLAAWLAALQAMLPPGRALTRDPDSMLTKVLQALGAQLLTAQLWCEALLQEWDPRRADKMLQEWEALLGLPDACMADLVLSVEDRRRLAFQRLIEKGGQSRAYFLALAELLGEPGVTITEFRPCNVGQNCNSSLYSEGDAFAWRVNIPRAVQGLRLANCNSPCDSALQMYTPSVIECFFNERKPAHTGLMFAYTG